MELFGLTLDKLLLRYYLMMAVIIIAGFIGQWWLALLGFPIFMSAIMGVRFKSEDKQQASAKMVRMKHEAREIKEAI